MNRRRASNMNTYPTILIAEDSESDQILIELGFEKAKFPFSIHFVPDGVCAREYLVGKGRYRNRAEFPAPIVLLTDLKMPRMNGLELLAWIREHEIWNRLPVIVITGSNQAEDLRRAMDLGANSYVVKDLLMRPPPALFEAILRLSSPPQVNVRDVWAQKATKVRT
jgi:CheY-like chemotaxis protein